MLRSPQHYLRFVMIALLSLTVSIASSILYHTNTVNNVSLLVSNCTNHISPTQKTIDGLESNYPPGSVICLDAGNRQSLKVKNLHGTSSNPIIIVNHGGVVYLKAGFSGIEITQSDHLRITGMGTSDRCGVSYHPSQQSCGIVISGGTLGIHGTHQTEEIEVDHVEISGGGGQGISIKTHADEGVARGEWVQHHTFLHHNYIHDQHDEGFYIGVSDWKDNPIHPELEDVEISHNLIIRTGWDAIQVGAAVKGCSIHHNRIDHYATLNTTSQNSGIMINPGSDCDVYENYLHTGSAWGIYVQGYVGGNQIYNNTIINAGSIGTGHGEGIHVSHGPNINVFQNTIINASEEAISFKETTGLVHDNIVVGGDKDSISTKLSSSANYGNRFYSTLAEAGLSDQFILTAPSPTPSPLPSTIHDLQSPSPTPSPLPSTIHDLQSPSPLPTPTPRHIVQASPHLGFLWPKTARVGRLYRRTIFGYDRGGHNLSMAAESLPPDFELNNCQESIIWLLRWSIIRCTLSGTPQNSGVYQTTLSVINESGLTDDKTTSFKILP